MTYGSFFKELAGVALVSIGLFTAATAGAEALSDINARKKVLVGIDLGIAPFGMTDEKMQPQGSDVDVARLFAKDLGVELEIVPLTGPNRIPYLMTKKVDMVISVFSITPEREKVIAFSNPYGINQLVLGAPKAVTIKGIDDLNGKRVGVVRGNLQDTVLTAAAPQGAKIVRFDDDATVATALTSGQIDAIVTPRTTLHTITTANPTKAIEVKQVLKSQPYAIGLRKEDTALRESVNKWIDANMNNGRLGTIYQKWVGVPLNAAMEIWQKQK
ncbi:MAG: transporter substrate-binding domain-containing protein [Noviherbaspirillum sp.]